MLLWPRIFNSFFNHSGLSWTFIFFIILQEYLGQSFESCTLTLIKSLVEKFDDLKPIYLFYLNNKYDLDGNYSWNTARLINHSCLNNCDYEGQGLKLWVVAIKDIKKGDELTCDYGFGYDSDYKQFPCKCGSINCAGYIVREGSRWRINKKFKKNQRISR